MTYSYTRSWWQIVRQVVAEVEAAKDGVLPWRTSYAEIFPTPESLLAALGYVWKLQVEAQVDAVGGTSLQQLMDAHPGLRAVLDGGPSTVATATDAAGSELHSALDVIQQLA